MEGLVLIHTGSYNFPLSSNFVTTWTQNGSRLHLVISNLTLKQKNKGLSYIVQAGNLGKLLLQLSNWRSSYYMYNVYHLL